MESSKLTRKILTPFVAVLVVITVSAILVTYYIQQQHIEDGALSRSDSFREIWQSTLRYESDKLTAILSFIEKDQQLREIWLSESRSDLYAYSMPMLEKIRQDFEVTHFYFISLDRSVFLRVHNRESYGDDVLRQTLIDAEISQGISSGIELGAYGHFTLRVVLPWIVDGKLAGYIELGEEIDHIIPGIKRVLGADFFLLVDKASVDFDNWHSIRPLRNDQDKWNQFDDQLLIAQTIPTLPQVLHAATNQRQGFESLKFSNAESIYHTGHAKLYDASNEPLVDVYLVKDISGDEARVKEFMLIFSLSSLGAGLLAFVFFYRHLSLTENLIRKNQEEIQDKNHRLKEALNESERATRAKTDFITNISHEIRTPMNGIIGATELMRGDENTREQKTHINIVHQSASALLHLINDLLDVSKIEAGKLTLDSGLFDCAKLVDDTVQLLGSGASEKGLIVEKDLSLLSHRYYHGDANRLRQILTNLIGNAIKFTESGSIKISCENIDRDETHSLLAIKITDTGIGIKKSNIDQLFSRFVQADSSITRRFGGTGLGLAISRQLCEMMSGELKVSSEYGHGSTFTVEVLLEKASADDHNRELSEDLKRNYRKHALLAEDNPVNQIVISALLERLGISVDIACDGLVAIGMFSKGNYDLVFMDLQMPNMDGLSATESIRHANNDCAPVPIVAITANAMEEDKIACQNAGMNGFLSKPLKLSTLITELDRIFTREDK